MPEGGSGLISAPDDNRSRPAKRVERGNKRAGWSAAEHCHVSENEVKSKHQCVCVVCAASAARAGALRNHLYIAESETKGVGLFPFS